jgi:hypothetical protein
MEAVANEVSVNGQAANRLNGLPKLAVQPDEGTERPFTRAFRTVAEEQGGLRLNLGSGELKLAGFDNVDIKDGRDIRNLDVPDGSCAEIRCSHTLEHMLLDDVLPVLRHWAAKLMPGGNLSIAVPDMEMVGRMLASRKYDPKVWNYIYGGQQNAHDFHRSGFTRPILEACLKAAGLKAPRVWYSDHADCAALPISLNVRATKAPFVMEDVMLGMTAPRLGFTETSAVLSRIAADFTMPQCVSKGVYWHHGLTRLFEDAQKRQIPFMLMVDYDSVFTSGHVMLLYDLIHQSGMDALCAIQSGREMPTILATAVDENGKLIERAPVEMLESPVLKIRTGHFGLTLLRTEKFASVPKPWFEDKPDADGSYGDGRIDSDVNFWLKWRDCGHTLGLATDCVIGHQQLVVSWPNKELQTQHQYMTDWDKYGKPEWAR